MQELRAQIQAKSKTKCCIGVDSGCIQAQLKLADAIRKLAEHAERNGIELDMDVQVQNRFLFCLQLILENIKSRDFHDDL